MRVTVVENGPYEVQGAIPLTEQIIEPNEHGESWEWREGRRYDAPETYRLCRCGATRTPPFCDGSEESIGFNGTETARRQPYLEQARVIVGPFLTLTDAPRYCAHARFCQARGEIWGAVERRDAASVALARRLAAHCPSGRLALWHVDPDGNRDPDPSPITSRRSG